MPQFPCPTPLMGVQQERVWGIATARSVNHAIDNAWRAALANAVNKADDTCRNYTCAPPCHRVGTIHWPQPPHGARVVRVIRLPLLRPWFVAIAYGQFTANFGCDPEGEPGLVEALTAWGSGGTAIPWEIRSGP